MLKDIFIQLVSKYSKDDVGSLWQEIEKAYSDKSRYYHNLLHLENLYNELLECKNDIADWDTVLFSLFYHDIIYKIRKTDNEEKSAEFAVSRLKIIHYPENKIIKCHEQIIATKSHDISSDNDTNLFTDADLSILGKSWDLYSQYYLQVRKEYSFYPDLLYKPGRKKVLQHFLSMESIYKTVFFREKYEQAAIENMKHELTKL